MRTRADLDQAMRRSKVVLGRGEWVTNAIQIIELRTRLESCVECFDKRGFSCRICEKYIAEMQMLLEDTYNEEEKIL